MYLYMHHRQNKCWRTKMIQDNTILFRQSTVFGNKYPVSKYCILNGLHIMVVNDTSMTCTWLVLTVTLNAPLYKISYLKEYHARFYILGAKNIKHFGSYHPSVRKK